MGFFDSIVNRVREEEEERRRREQELAQATQAAATPAPEPTPVPAPEPVKPAETQPSSARQRMLFSPEPEQTWYSGEQPTRSEILAQIFTVGQQDKAKGQTLWDAYQQFQADPSSPLYNPYTKSTNKAATELAALGLDMTGGINDEWFEKNSWLKNYYRMENGTSPLAPSKKSTAAENAAYWYYKALSAEDTTKQAETEWEALQDELTYWATRTDRNYSDDEILNKVDWSNYSTLTGMDKDAAAGLPTTLNRPIGYSQDALKGVIWAAHNGSTGDQAMDSVNAVLGNGKQWKEDKLISQRLDPTSPQYSPYSVGSTLEDEGLYFGVQSFNQDWIDQHRDILSGNDATAKKYYANVVRAEETTQKAEQELKDLKSSINDWLKYTTDPDVILSGLLDDYPTLKKMDESRKTADLLPTTRAVRYRMEDIENDVRMRCLRENSKPHGQEFVANTTSLLGVSTPKSESISAATDTSDNLINAGGAIIRDVGTPEEKSVFENAYTSTFEEDATAIARAIYEGEGPAPTPRPAPTPLPDYTPGPEQRVTLPDTTPGNGVQITSAINRLDEQPNPTRTINPGPTPAPAPELPHVEMTVAPPTQTPETTPAPVTETPAPPTQTPETTPAPVAETTVSPEESAYRRDREQWLARRQRKYDYVQQAADQAAGEGYLSAKVTIDKYTAAQRDKEAAEAELASIGAPMTAEEEQEDALAALQRQQAFIMGEAEEPTAVFDEATEARINSLQNRIAQADSTMQELEDEYGQAQKTMRSILGKYKVASNVRDMLDVEGHDPILADLDAAYQLGSVYTPTSWDAYSLYDRAMQEGSSYAETAEAATQGRAANVEALETINAFMSRLEQAGVQIPDDLRSNIEREQARLQRDIEAADYFLLSENEDFDRIADEEAAKIQAAWGGPIFLETPWSTRDGYSRLDRAMSSQESALMEGNALVGAMEEVERKRYLYLRATQGPDAAQKYYDSLTDESYGIIHTRLSGAMEATTQQFAEELPFTSTLMSIAAGPLKLAGTVYTLKSMITGDEINPHNATFTPGAFSGTIRSTVKNEIDKTYGDSFIGKALNLFYDAGTSAADSMLNSWLFGGVSLGSEAAANVAARIGLKVTEGIIGAAPMGLQAAGEAVREAKADGATDSQALLMGLVTFAAETGTEAITFNNIQDAIAAGGADSGADTLRALVKQWARDAFTEEAPGEMINELVETLSDDAIMGELSARNKMKQSYIEQGMDPDEAELRSWRDVTGNVLRAGLTALVSTGVSTGGSYAFGKITSGNGISEEVTPETQEEITPEAVEETAPEITPNAVEEQVAETTPTAVEETPADFEEVTPEDVETSSEPAPITQEPVETEESDLGDTPDLSPNPGVFGPDMIEAEQHEQEYTIVAQQATALTAALQGDEAAQTATIAAVLSPPNQTIDSTSTASVAAQKLRSTYGEDAIELTQQLLLEASNSGLHNEEIQTSIMTAVLGEGAAKNILDQMAENGVTSEGVMSLVEAAISDTQDPAVVAHMQQVKLDNQYATRVAAHVAAGELAGLTSYQDAVQQAKTNEANAEQAMSNITDQLNAATDNLNTVMEQHSADPLNKDLISAVDQAISDVQGLVKVAQEYEQSLTNAQEATQAAQNTLDTQTDIAMQSVRENAQADVAEVQQAQAEELAAAHAAIDAEAYTAAVEALPPAVGFGKLVPAITQDGDHLALSGIAYMDANADYYFTTADGNVVSMLQLADYGLETNVYDEYIQKLNGVEPYTWMPKMEFNEYTGAPVFPLQKSVGAYIVGTDEHVQVAGVAPFDLSGDPYVQLTDGRVVAWSDLDPDYGAMAPLMQTITNNELAIQEAWGFISHIYNNQTSTTHGLVAMLNGYSDEQKEIVGKVWDKILTKYRPQLEDAYGPQTAATEPTATTPSQTANQEGEALNQETAETPIQEGTATPASQFAAPIDAKVVKLGDVKITGIAYQDADGISYFTTDSGKVIGMSVIYPDYQDSLYAEEDLLSDETKETLQSGAKPVVALPISATATVNSTGESVEVLGIAPTPPDSDVKLTLANGNVMYLSELTLEDSDMNKLENLWTTYQDEIEQAGEQELLQQIEQAANEPAQDTSTQQTVETETAENPSGLQLEPWQNPQYHGKPKSLRKLRTDTKSFKNWFNDPTGDLTNPDGTPKIIYRGTASKLYMQHLAKSGGDYMNWYSDYLPIAKSYANGSSHIIHTYDIQNWETAEKAMADEGFQLMKEQDAQGNWGYRPYNSHTGATGDFYREDEISRFNHEYGKARRDGMYAGYISLKNPAVIDAQGAAYTGTHGTLLDKHGNPYTATMKTRLWAQWAREQGYDALIVRNSRDYIVNNGPNVTPGTVIVTFKPSSFKSMWNTGKLGKKNQDIRYAKPGTFALTGKPVSSQMKAVTDKLALNQPVSVEDVLATPEVKWAEEHMMKGESVPWRSKANGGQYSPEEMQKLVGPERYQLQLDIQDELEGRGSYSGEGADGDQYDGPVAHDKRIDIVVGPPAAGKSTALVNPLSAKYHSKVLDSDDVKTMLPEYQGGLNSGYLHTESRYIWEHMVAESMGKGENVVIPVVGHSINSVWDTVDAAKKLGYTVGVHYVELDGYKALGRALQRYLHRGRYIDFKYLMDNSLDGKITDNYGIMKGDARVDEYSHWSNDVQRGQKPVRVEASTDILRDLVSSGGNAQLLGSTGTNGAAGQSTGGLEVIKAFRKGKGNNPGKLAAAPGRTDGRGSLLYARQGTGESGAGRGAEGQAGYLGSNQSGVPQGLLSPEARQNLTDHGVTDLHLRVENDQQRFSSALDAAKASNSHGAYVDAQSVEALQEKGAVILQSEDGLAGAAVATTGNEKGNIFGVFKDASSTAKGASAELIIQAIANGGNKLDCYDGGLSGMYQRMGMIPVARVAFNEEFMPDDWNVERDDHPDIVFWMHNGDSADTVARKYGLSEEEGGYHRYTKAEMAALPLFGDVTDENGETQYGYDRAWAYRDQMLADAQAERENTNGKPPAPSLFFSQKAQQSTPQRTTAPTVKPTRSPQQIAKDLATKLGVGDFIGTKRMNRLPEYVRGYYATRAKHIAVRNSEAGNFVVGIHEVGHAIADKLGMKGTQQMIDNLPDDFKDAYPASELPDEAFAEFMWRYLSDEQVGRQFAGDDFVDQFERALKDNGLADDVHAAAKDLRAWINANTNDQIGATIRSRGSEKKLGWREQFRRLINSTVDATNAAEAVNQSIRKQTKTNAIPLNRDVRANALLHNFTSRRTSAVLNTALTDSNGNRIGDSLSDALAKTGLRSKDAELLERYMLALHSLDRDAQGKPVFDSHITTSDRVDFINDVQQHHPEVARAAEAFQEWRKAFLQSWMVDTGFLSQAAFDDLNATYPNYVPTMRVKDERYRNLNRNGGKKYTIRQAVGSTEDIWSPIDTFVGMVDSIVNMVSANKVGLAWDAAYRAYDLGEFGREVTADMHKTTVNTVGLQDKVTDILNGNTDADTMQAVLDAIGTEQSQWTSGGLTLPNGLIVQRPDGSKAYYEIADTELYKLLAGLNDSSTSQNKLLQMVAKITRGMSALTTGSNPVFAVRNFMRDFQNSVNYGSWASNYGSGMAKWIASAYEVWRESDAYKDYEALGGGGWTRVDAATKKGVKDYRSELFQGYNTENVGRTVKYAGKKLWNAITLSRLNEVVEQASRFAEYRYGKHDLGTETGRTEAFMAAQEATVDFARSGNGQLGGMLKALVPFFGASTQGVYRTGRMLTESERSRMPQRFAKTIINTGLASILANALMMKFTDDDEKKEFEMLSDDLKSKHFYIPNFAPDVLGEQPLIRIPLAQDPLTYAVHGAVTNAMWNGTTDEDMIDLMTIGNTIMDNLNPLGSGTVFQPIIGVGQNKNWYGSRIVPSRMSTWEPTTQYTEETPDIFIEAGRITGMSPLNIQYLAEQYTGFLGQMAIPALSKDKHTGELGGVQAAIASAQKRLTSDPLISNDVVGSFYDGANILTQVTTAAKNGRPLNMLRRGLTPEEATAAYEEAKELTGSNGIVGTTKSKISGLYAEIDEINSNQTLTPQEKYTLTSEKRREMIAAVLDAQEALGAYQEKYINGRNIATDALFKGASAYIPTAYDNLDQTFKADENQPYMIQARSVWEATGKDNALPHPNYSFSSDKVDYTVGEEDREGFDTQYKVAYQKYLGENDTNWERLSTEEQLEILLAAHTAGHNAAKKWYKKLHGIK